MTTVYDVKADNLIQKTAEKLKDDIEQPEWSLFVKTGVSRERAPENKDWWFVRAASMLRKIYMKGPLGISTLRTMYGGRQRRGHKQDHFKKAGGKIIRTILQQLEKQEYIETEKGEGRKITPKGQKFLDNISKEVSG